jgi:hypothetical protein
VTSAARPGSAVGDRSTTPRDRSAGSGSAGVHVRNQAVPGASDALDARLAPCELAEAMKVAFIGTYPDRHCGLAQYAEQLVAAMANVGRRFEPIIIPISDECQRVDYSHVAAIEIRRDVLSDYHAVAFQSHCLFFT